MGRDREVSIFWEKCHEVYATNRSVSARLPRAFGALPRLSLGVGPFFSFVPLLFRPFSDVETVRRKSLTAKHGFS